MVKLEQNYRSTQTILDAANAVIRNNRGQKPKSLWTEHRAGRPDQDPRARRRARRGAVRDRRDPAAGRRGHLAREIAVFYRTNSQSRVLEDTLVRAEIAYQVIGGTKFYERAEIKDAIAYLTVLVNPQDVGAFTRIVNSPRRGIGNDHDLAAAGVLQHDRRDRLGAGGGARGRARARRGRDQVAAAVHGHDGGAARAGEPAPRSRTLLNEMLQETGYLEALENERTIEAQGRIENLEELVNVAAEYDVARRASRRWRSSCSRSRSSPTPTRASTTRAS